MRTLDKWFIFGNLAFLFAWNAELLEIGPLLVLFIPLFYLWIVWVLDFFVNDDLDVERGNSTVWLIRFLLSVGFIIALIIAWLSGDPNAGFYDY